MPANFDAIDLDQIDDPTLRSQIADAIAEHQILQHNYLLAQRNAQFKSHFLARISHELRSPLSGIIGSHQLVLADLCEDVNEEHDFIEEANTAALKLVQMLDSLLMISRLESGRRPLKLQPLSVGQLLSWTCEPIELEAASSSISFQAVADDPDVAIAADKDIIVSVIVDFLELAIDAGRSDGASVQLTCHSRADTVEFCLDSGLTAADFADPLDLFSQTVARDGSQPPLPKFSLAPSVRLTLNHLLLDTMGGRCELPTPIGAEHTRLRFWLPRAQSC